MNQATYFALRLNRIFEKQTTKCETMSEIDLNVHL